jgi:hypothetical protein
MKSTCNKLGELIVKLVTNGLWGKFGQLANLWIIDQTERPDRQYGGFIKVDPLDLSEKHYRIINWVVSRLTSTKWSDNTFPAIAAYANSLARFTLWQAVQMAGLSNVLYCCIDGVIVNEAGFNRLRVLCSDNPESYGLFRVSEKEKSCYIEKYGVYKIGNKTAYQGIPLEETVRYSGFWSLLHDKLLTHNEGMASRNPVVSTVTPTSLRSALGKDKPDTGSFTADVVLDELCLPSLPDSPPCQQQDSLFAAWSR